jgi:hypothetical protein
MRELIRACVRIELQIVPGEWPSDLSYLLYESGTSHRWLMILAIEWVRTRKRNGKRRRVT